MSNIMSNMSSDFRYDITNVNEFLNGFKDLSNHQKITFWHQLILDITGAPGFIPGIEKEESFMQSFKELIADFNPFELFIIYNYVNQDVCKISVSLNTLIWESLETLINKEQNG